MSEERANQRGRNAQRGDLVAFHQRPQAVRFRIVQRAVVEHHGRAQQQRSEDQPRPHHPAHVRDPGMQVKAVAQILGGLDGKSAVRMYRALGLARCAGSIKDHQRVFRGGRRRLGLIAGLRHQIVPPMIATGSPRDINA